MIEIGGRGLYMPGGIRIGIGAPGVGIGGGGGLLPFTDDFNRADGAIGNGWTGPTWTISGNKAVNTPALGAELLTDGGLENWLSATNLTSWTEAPGGTSTINQETSIVHGGSNAARLDIDAGNSNTSIRSLTDMLANAWLRATFWMRASALGKTGRVSIGTTVAVSGLERNPGATWTNYLDVLRVPDAAVRVMLFLRVSAASASLYFDDCSAKQLTLSTLFSTQGFPRADVDISVKATIVAGTQAGVVLNLDSAITPANFVIGYHDGVSAKLDKCVAGVYTNLITATATYSAGAAVRVTKSGTTYKLWYNGVQIGTDQTVSDVGIISNTLHGMFKTYEGNSVDDFSIEAE